MDLTGQDFSRAQYWTEFDERGERLVMRLRRRWQPVLLALGGTLLLLGIKSMPLWEHRENLQGSDYLLLAMLTAAVVHLLINAVTSLVARETIRIEGGNLVHGLSVLGLRRERRYRLTDIEHLTTDEAGQGEERKQLISPLLDFGKQGMVKFRYHDGMRGIGAALDLAHGEQVVAWIARRIPRLPAGY